MCQQKLREREREREGRFDTRKAKNVLQREPELSNLLNLNPDLVMPVSEAEGGIVSSREIVFRSVRDVVLLQKLEQLLSMRNNFVLIAPARIG